MDRLYLCGKYACVFFGILLLIPAVPALVLINLACWFDDRVRESISG